MLVLPLLMLKIAMVMTTTMMMMMMMMMMTMATLTVTGYTKLIRDDLGPYDDVEQVTVNSEARTGQGGTNHFPTGMHSQSLS